MIDAPATSDLSDLVTPASVVAGEAMAGKKALFHRIGALAKARLGTDPADVIERLGDRERLGSTGFGGGIALPHAKIDGLREVAGFFFRLTQPIDFHAIDHLPVDLVFALLSPPDAGAEHLKALARVSRRMRERPFVAKLRGAGSADALYALISAVDARDAA